MRSMPLALLWETLYRGRWSLWGFFLLGIFTPLAFYRTLSPLVVDFRSDRAFMGLQCGFLTMMLFLFAMGVTHALGSCSRLFTLPISATSMVAWHIGAGATLMGIEATAAGWLLNWLYDLSWPIWGSALYAAAAWSVFQLLLCVANQPSVSSFFVAVSPLVWLSLWLHSRFGAWFSQPSHYWNEVTTVEQMTLISVIAVSFPLYVWGINRVRCGEGLPSLGFLAWLVRVWESFYRMNDLSAFRSATKAQFWFEWKQKGFALPVLVGLELFFAGFVGVCTWLASQNSWPDVHVGILTCGGIVSLLAIGTGAILGMNLNAGSSGHRSPRLGDAIGQSESMGHFLSTRPLSNLDLAQAILRMAALSTLIAWAIWFVAFVAIFGVMLSAFQLPSPIIPGGAGAWFLPLTLLGPWIFMANLPSIGLSGRGHPIAFAGIIALTLFGILSITIKECVSTTAEIQLHTVSAVLVCMLIVWSTAWLFAKAYRAKIYGSKSLTAFGITCSGIVIAAITVSPMPMHFTLLAAIFAFASLVVLPFATMPLAIAWNRHR